MYSTWKILHDQTSWKHTPDEQEYKYYGHIPWVSAVFIIFVIIVIFLLHRLSLMIGLLRFIDLKYREDTSIIILTFSMIVVTSATKIHIATFLKVPYSCSDMCTSCL